MHRTVFEAEKEITVARRQGNNRHTALRVAKAILMPLHMDSISISVLQALGYIPVRNEPVQLISNITL